MNTAATMRAYCEIPGDVWVKIRKEGEETIAMCASCGFKERGGGVFNNHPFQVNNRWYIEVRWSC